jgi:glycosyltransferase involved in cell wall biosynthesis
MGEVLEAMHLLKDSPIEFSIVGKEQMEIPSDLRANPRIRWIGPVPRTSVADCYQQADVFLFPTLSDGFGMTQLEAQAWKLPVIASRFCGDVVEHGRNGWLLPEVSGQAISERLSDCVRHPEMLMAAAVESGVAPRYRLSAIGDSLSRLASNNRSMSHS